MSDSRKHEHHEHEHEHHEHDHEHFEHEHEEVKLRNFELIGVAVIMMIATVITAGLSNLGNNAPIGSSFIIPSNISLFQIAEYMFTSIIIYSVIEYLFFGDEFRNFFFAKASAALAGPILFLFLTYFLNITVGYVDRSFYIATFFISTALAQLLSYYFLREGIYFRLMNAYGVAMAVLLLVVYMVYSNSRLYMSPIFEPLDSYERSINSPYY